MSDKEILDIFRTSGRECEAFDLIVKQYGERVYWHIRKIVISHEDANDLLQDTLIKAWRALPSFREESRLFTWLYRIATNESVTFLKRSAGLRSLLSSTDSMSLVTKLEADPFFSGDKIHSEFQKAILELPKKQRLVFNMRYFDDLKYEEISEILGTSVGALKASYHHATQKIERYMKDSI